MKIWHFCASPVDPDRETGGVSNVVRALALQSANNGIPTTVVCGRHELGRETRDAGEVRYSSSLRVLTLDSSRPIQMLRLLRREISRIPPEGVSHVHAGFSLFSEAVMLLLRSKQLTYVYSPHGKLSQGMLANRRMMKMGLWSIVGRKNANSAATIGLFSDAEANQFARLRLVRSWNTIPNGFYKSDEDENCAAAPYDDPYLLFLGYLDPRKQPRLLLEAFARTQSRDRYILVLVGPDSYGHRDELEKLAIALGIQKRVRFHGPAYGEEKWRLLRNARALALPSLAEGMPIVLAEAAGAGTPSLFSRQSNGELFERRRAGRQIDNFDPGTWAAAIDEICGSDALRRCMSENAIALSVELTWSAIGRQWIDLYSALTASKVNISE
jgi:glycosyltransferase involved in cell wall biosynthesis